MKNFDSFNRALVVPRETTLRLNSKVIVVSFNRALVVPRETRIKLLFGVGFRSVSIGPWLYPGKRGKQGSSDTGKVSFNRALVVPRETNEL